MKGVVLVKDWSLENFEEANTMVEQTMGGTREELWLKDRVTPRGRSTEAEPGYLEEPAERRDRRTRATSQAWKPKVERLARVPEAEPGIRLTRATMEPARTTGKPEEGRSLVKPKGWRVEAKPETRKSVAEAERRPTEVCPDVRGSPEES